MSRAERFHEVIAAALAGDRLAQGMLFLDYYDVVAARVRKRVPASLAEVLSVDDLVQQSYLTALRSLGHYEHRSQESFEAWLLTIAERQTLNAADHLFRRRRRLTARPLGPPPGDRSSWFSLAERWMAADGTTSDKLARDEAVRAVQVAVAVLPSDQRAAVALHHLQGQSVEATAAKLCRSPAAVRGLLQRARNSLRELLGRSSRWFERKP